MAEAAASFEARCLVRGAAVASLATAREGQPFVSLVTPATAPDLSVLLWLSTLAEHTRQLQAEPRCSLLFTGEAPEANPQTMPRITLTGLAEKVPEAELPALKARWLARHPYAALYAGFADFALWRVRPAAALLVGGFGRAQRLRAADLAPDPQAVAAIAAAEAGIIAHMNQDHADAAARIAQHLLGQAAGDWRLVAVDVDGCDLANGERSCRLAFSQPVSTVAAVRQELVQASRAAHS